MIIISYKQKWNNSNTLTTALAFKKTGRNDEGEKLLADWVAKEPENKLARWCLEVYRGNKPVSDFEGNDNFRIIRELLVIQ